MAIELKDLCRLCAKKDEFSKDLLDENNKNVLKMIQDLVQIVVCDNDSLPTKICLNCEEKMVSFQLFILECGKVQETLKKMCVENMDLQIKIEVEGVPDYGAPLIKTEVKYEMTAEDIVSELNNDESLQDLPEFDDNCDIENNPDDDDDDDDDDEEEDDDDGDGDGDDDEDIDDVTIATLKQVIKKKKKHKGTPKLPPKEFNEIMKKTSLKVNDFIKLECHLCDKKRKTWFGLNSHYNRIHKRKPLVFCLCGFEIKSKSVLYRHVSDHKKEIRKLNNTSESDDEKPVLEEYSSLKVKDFVNFICDFCELKCSSWYTLQDHCEKRHKTQPVVKCVCGILLKSKTVMYKHIQDHKKPNVLACDKCPRITKTLAAFNKHKMRHVPKTERKFYCSSCNKVFNALEALKSHEKSHIPIEERKIYHCDICNMKFTTRSSASSHKRVVHDKIKGYMCDLCGYACGTNGELRQHRAIHSDDKPYVCKKCSKRFKTYANLKTHMDTHDDTSYECYICRRVLNSKRTLRKHLIVHEDKSQHVCSYCNKAFKRRQTLKVHMYTHTGDKPLTCKWCEERFAYASTLRSHRLRCHPDKMAAPTAHNYQPYQQPAPPPPTEDYIRNVITAAVNASVTKNEVEVM